MALTLQQGATLATHVDTRRSLASASSVRALLPCAKVVARRNAFKCLNPKSSCVSGAVHGGVNRRRTLTNCAAAKHTAVMYSFALEGMHCNLFRCNLSISAWKRAWKHEINRTHECNYMWQRQVSYTSS